MGASLSFWILTSPLWIISHGYIPLLAKRGQCTCCTHYTKPQELMPVGKPLPKQLEVLRPSGTYYAPYSTSLRMSDLGYKNNVQGRQEFLNLMRRIALHTFDNGQCFSCAAAI